MSGPWIQTRDNLKFDLVSPQPEAISPEVIAAVLARTARFGGHDCGPVDLFYSNAQHSLLVCEIVESAGYSGLMLPALLHDAHEVYSGFGDVLRPAQQVNRDVGQWIKLHQEEVDFAIARRFGFASKLFRNDAIKTADAIALATEARDVMGPPPEPWCQLPPPMERPIVVMGIRQAYEAFLAKLNQLTWQG